MPNKISDIALFGVLNMASLAKPWRDRLRGCLCVLLCVLAMAACAPARAITPLQLVEALGLAELATTASGKVTRSWLPPRHALPSEQTQAMAVLIANGLAEAEWALLPPATRQAMLSRVQRAHEHGYFVRSQAMGHFWPEEAPHSALATDRTLLPVLGDLLQAGVITGFDLRPGNVFADFPAGRSLIYSHGSKAHIQQLMGLLKLHRLQAQVFVAPKISAFLYREGWGGNTDHLTTLASGARVVNGREVAVLFEFHNGADRARFHELVLAFAKKDQPDETGLLVDAWWQPVYYADTPLDGFQLINLVIVRSANTEATLTVKVEKLTGLRTALTQRGLTSVVEDVWVNPAFYRFLSGEYR